MGKTLRRCLLCRSRAADVPPEKGIRRQTCGLTVCSLFGLSDKHPIKVIFDRADYCQACQEELYQADVTLGKLECLKQSLLRFQNRVYSKLGENYFKIQSREELDVTHELFEGSDESWKGRKFKYDEVVKVVYEKLDKNCLYWESFSNQSPLPPAEASTKVENYTQTDPEEPPPPIPITTQIVVCTETPIWDHSVHEEIICNTETIESDQPLHPQGSQCPSPQLFSKVPPDFSEKIFCPVENCSRFFYDNYNLSVHIRSFHEGNPLPHECPVCKRCFVDESRLKNHYYRVHSSSSSFLCDYCGQGFPSKSTLREHVRKKHNPNPPTKSVCNLCSYPSPSPSHTDLHASLTDIPFSCVICSPPLSFPNSTSLRSHVSLLHRPDRVPCSLCPKQFASEQSLRNHMNTHTGDFTCSQCGVKCATSSGLKTHEQSHSTDKPFACETCGHCFKYQKNLTSHMRIHTGEKPYSCPLCGISFRELSYLKRHEESHSTTDNYRCQTCGRGFKVKESLHKHKRTHLDGYSPKKKLYKPRSEYQKMQRRLKRLKVVGEASTLVKSRAAKKSQKKPKRRRRIEVTGLEIARVPQSMEEEIVTAVRSIEAGEMFEGQVVFTTTAPTLIPVELVSTATGGATPGIQTEQELEVIVAKNDLIK